MNGTRISASMKDAMIRNAIAENKLKADVDSMKFMGKMTNNQAKSDKAMLQKKQKEHGIKAQRSVEDGEVSKILNRPVSLSNQLARARSPAMKPSNGKLSSSSAPTSDGGFFVTNLEDLKSHPRAPATPERTRKQLRLPPLGTSGTEGVPKISIQRSRSPTVPFDTDSSLAVDKNISKRMPSPNPRRKEMLSVEESPNATTSRSAPNSPSLGRRNMGAADAGSNVDMKRFEEILSGINRSFDQEIKNLRSRQYVRRRSGNVPTTDLPEPPTRWKKTESLGESFEKLKHCKYLRGRDDLGIEDDEKLPKELVPTNIVIGHTKPANVQ